MWNNKRIVIISIVSVLALVVAIIATSYAVFTSNLTGTKENKLTTGYVTMNCAETNFNLSNTHESQSRLVLSTILNIRHILNSYLHFPKLFSLILPNKGT